ncbi:DUF342 domain-containing protein [Gynuella sp.]|uniref:DUF342 domain-containing protein n=1 Tax=Gynuella sp. TaxID=2969146 RepID=UPI003D1222E1
MTETTDTNPIYPELDFELDSQSGVLTASFREAKGKAKIDHDYLIEQVVNAGFGDLFFRDEAIQNFLFKASNEDAGEADIAEKRDAEISISVADDHMKAYATTTQAYGGATLTADDVVRALKNKGVIEQAMDMDAIQKLITLPFTNKMQVATGKQSVIGKNGYFKWLLEKEETSVHFVGNDEGIVDFRAGKKYLVVDQGASVLKYVPAEKGSDGYDIRGHTLNGADGKDIKAERNWEGIEQAYHDPNIYVAKYKGHPVNLNPGARIDKSLQFKAIDLKTGHVKFDGSLEINGDILPGMKVQATGDIFIRGTIESALVESGANIYIAGGILGNEQETKDDVVLPEHFECYIRAKGDVHARFVSSVQIYAGHDIHLREYSMHSELYAGNGLFLGQEGGKGILIGGQAIVGKTAVVNQLGNGTYVITQLQIGLSDTLDRHFQYLKDEKHELQSQAQTHIEALQTLKTNHPDVESLDQETLQRVFEIKATINRLKHRAHELNFKIHCYTAMDTPGKYSVSSRKAYPNVNIGIMNLVRKLEHEHNHLSLESDGQAIVDN